MSNVIVLDTLRCSKCGEMKLCKMCSACGGALYCSTECQKEDWGKHKKLCQDTKTVSIPPMPGTLGQESTLKLGELEKLYNKKLIPVLLITDFNKAAKGKSIMKELLSGKINLEEQSALVVSGDSVDLALGMNTGVIIDLVKFVVYDTKADVYDPDIPELKFAQRNGDYLICSR